jgi:hypothetical protein
VHGTQSVRVRVRVTLERPEMAIFVDEVEKDRWTVSNDYAIFNLNKPYTLIGVADCFGFVTSSCELYCPEDKEREEDKLISTDKFVTFVRDNLVPELGNFARKEDHSVVILDESETHLDQNSHRGCWSYSALFYPILL